MATFEQAVSGLLKGIEFSEKIGTAGDGKDFSESAADFADACEAYQGDPSAENAQAVRDAFDKATSDGVSFLSNFLPGDPFSDVNKKAIESFDKLIKNGANDSELKELVKWQEAFEERSNGVVDRPDIDTACKDFFSSAQTAGLPSPLIFDLNNNGFETVGADKGPMYDLDGNAIKNPTGWTSDAILVRDLNANGIIDSGREMFGDQTLKADGTRYADGFAALAALDTNGDKKITSADAAFASLKMWQDDGDGVTEAGELKTLSALGITEISTAKAPYNTLTYTGTELNGNRLDGLGTFVQAGVTKQYTDAWFGQDTFHTQLPDTIAVAADVATLPDMQGSGLVRDLQQAASMATPAGAALKAALSAYSKLTTRDAQLAALDNLLLKWADTSSLKVFSARGTSTLTVAWSTSAVKSEWENKLHVLEAFNGRYFFTLPGDTNTGQANGISISSPDASGKITATANLAYTQTDPLQSSYDALKKSVYDSLLGQTRFKAYLDSLNLNISADGVRLEGNAVDAAIAGKLASADAAIRVNALTDFLELNQYVGSSPSAFAVWSQVANFIRTTPITPALQSLYDQFGITAEGVTTYFNPSSGGIILGGASNNSLNGSKNADVLSGGLGNDTLYGGEGDDVYLFNKGDGQDSIGDFGSGLKSDTLVFGTGILATSVTVKRSFDDLVLTVNGSSDQVTLRDYFKGDAAGGYQLNAIRFADGTSWDVAKVKALAITGTSANDTLQGYATADTINADAGDDSITAGAGNDVLNGEVGNDTILGGAGDDTISGGAGNDVLKGDQGHDTYLFGRGDGQDVVRQGEVDGITDTVQLKAGISFADITLTDVSGDFVLGIKGTSDTLTLNSDTKIDKIKLADGSEIGITRGNRDSSNSMTGTANADYLRGGSSADTINGGAGADWLNGLEGDDTLVGGTGDDTYFVSNYPTESGNAWYIPDHSQPTDIVVEKANEGIDTVVSNTWSTKLPDNVENLTMYSMDQTNYRAYTSDYLGHILQGNDLDNVIDSSAVARQKYEFLIDGGKGKDTMLGGASDDRYIVDNTGDKVIEKGIAADGSQLSVDRVESSVSFALGDNLENLIFSTTSSNVLTGTGNALNNNIQGNYLGSILKGGAGNDALSGDGDSSLQGQMQIDSLVVYAKAKLAVGVAPIMEVWLDDKKIQSFNVTSTDYAAYKVTAPLGVSGKELQVRFTNDYYNAPTLEDRNLYIQKIEVGGALGGASTPDGSITGVRTLLATDPGVFYDQGLGSSANDGVNVMSSTGSVGSNGSLRFSLSGGDLLDGGTGADTMIGGFGNDTYIVDNAGDTITEYPSGSDFYYGYDEVRSSVSYTLPENVEGIVLTGTSAINATGNSTTNNLFGNSAANILDGKGAADYMAGGAGDDTYFVDNSGDVVYEAASAGTDTVKASINYTLGNNLENLTLTSTGNTNATGNTLNNVINGNSGNNILDGKAGNDTLNGGNGSDTYIFAKGYGLDIINNYDVGVGKKDVIKLSGLKAADITTTREGDDLLIKIKSTTDSLRVTKHFIAGNQIDAIQFADGSSWDGVDIKAKVAGTSAAKTASASTLAATSKSLQATPTVLAPQTLSAQISNDVDALVAAMAAFAPQTSAQTSTLPDYRSSLQVQIAVNGS